MKTKKELIKIKEEYETIGNKLAELNEEELKQVVGSGPKIISPILRQLMSETGKTWTFDIGVTDPPVSGWRTTSTITLSEETHEGKRRT